MRLGAVFADVLANLELAQLLNDVGPDEQRDQQRREGGESGAKRQIAEDAEGVKERETAFDRAASRASGLRIELRRDSA